MLVLTRKQDESIRIAHEITVKVLSTKGNRVRLGIDAPDDVLVLRREVLLAMDSEPADQGERHTTVIAE